MVLSQGKSFIFKVNLINVKNVAIIRLISEITEYGDFTLLDMDVKDLEGSNKITETEGGKADSEQINTKTITENIHF
jgi:hypothetical protein